MLTPLEEVEFLTRSEYRVEVLDLLNEAPREHSELRGAVSASNATIHRILVDFRDREWVRRAGREYVLTIPGKFIAETMDDVLTRVTVEHRLRDVWRWIPADLLDDDLGRFLDAVVTTASPDDPYAAENRCASFLRRTSRLKGFDAVVSSPISFKILSQRIVKGLAAEFILSPTVTERLSQSYPEMYRTVSTSNHFTLWMNPDLPLVRLMIFDDRVGIGGYDNRTGMLAAYVDTDNAAVRDWAIVTLEEQREQATLAASRSSSA